MDFPSHSTYYISSSLTVCYHMHATFQHCCAYTVQDTAQQHRLQDIQHRFQKIFQLRAWHSSCVSYTQFFATLWAERDWYLLRRRICWWMQWCTTFDGHHKHAEHNTVPVFSFSFFFFFSKTELLLNTWQHLRMAEKRSPWHRDLNSSLWKMLAYCHPWCP